MERFRRRKSKTSTGIEGTQKTLKHNSFQTPVSESHFSSHGTTKENSVMYEMRRNSFERDTGAPMKKLLAKEMLKESEGKRRSPSVIARLMGLDGMPSPQPVHRQYKMLSNRNNSSTEKQKFKDVYEDLEASHITNRRYSNDFGHSNNDSLLKYLHDLDSLHAKHMQGNSNGNSSSSLHSHITGLNPPNSENYEANSKGWKTESETWKIEKTHQGSRRRDCLLSYALESSEPEEKTLLKTIVILKPSVWTLCNDVKAISSSGNVVRDDHQLNQVNLAADNSSTDFSDQYSKKAREIAREVVQQMKKESNGGRLTSPFTETREYANEEKPMKVSERELEAWRKSSVIQEAKKRLSARWKSTRTKSRYEQVVGKGSSSTLGEMLAIPESETKAEMLDDGLAGYGGSAAWERSPGGISSRDGWKDGGSPKSKEAVRRGRSRVVKANANSNKKENSLLKNVGSRNKKPHSRRRMYEAGKIAEKSDTSDSVVSHIPSSVGSTSSVVDAEDERLNVSSASSDELRPLLRKDDSARHQEESNSQVPSEGTSHAPSTEPVPESSESSKESNRQSPVSVLSVPSTEDLSSGSYSFESVSVGLQELRMQLQLLKMESQANTESPIHEDMWPGSVSVSQEKGLDSFSSWESSYVVDLLIESGFNGSEPDMFTRTWYSQYCPLGPWVFNNLENKYTDELTCQRLERKLLFNRVNSALVEIFESSMNPLPWVRPSIVTVGLKLQKHGIEFEVHKLLERQEEEANENITEKAIDRETEWVDLGEGIDEIGMEIESLMIDELIEELVTM